MSGTKVGSSDPHPMSSRLDMHMHVKMHDGEQSKFRGSKGRNQAPISSSRRNWLPIRETVGGQVEGKKVNTHGNTWGSDSELFSSNLV